MTSELNDPKAIWQEIKGVQSSQRLLGTEMDEVRRVLAAEARYRTTLEKRLAALEGAQAVRDREQAVRDAARDKFQERILQAVEGDPGLRYPGLRADLERVIAKLEDGVASRAKVAELERQVVELESGMENMQKRDQAFRDRVEGALGLARVALGLLGLAGASGIIAYISQLLGVG